MTDFFDKRLLLNAKSIIMGHGIRTECTLYLLPEDGFPERMSKE